MLCLAYVAGLFRDEERLRFLGFHARAALKVIKSYLKRGWILVAVEHSGNGFRIDLLFRHPALGIVRLVEVKTAKRIREVFKVQAALYFPLSGADEAAVSNGETEELLTVSFIERTLAQAKKTLQLLTCDPLGAAKTYTPHEDACYTCGNETCPFLQCRPGFPTKKGNGPA
jgi:hypothetical protein